MTRRSIRLPALLVAVVTLITLGLGVGSAASAANPHTGTPTTSTVTGTLADGTGAVNGTFDVTRFANQSGQLTAIGTFTGTITDAAGTVLASGTNVPLSLPVNTQASSGSCQILDLVLGPLDLDLLGLQVHLDTVHLNITAQQGPGNLLGNLLCAVAGLLDNSPTGLNALVTQLSNLLNQILGAL